MKETGDFDFPRSIVIDTVSYCNLKCSMCSHKVMTRKKRIMKWGLFRKIIDEISEVDKSITAWLVFFGEALTAKRTKPSIFDMVSYAKSAGLERVVLNSNGTLLDRETSEKMVKAGLDAIYIGIDAFSKETYDRIRVGGDYGKVVRNVLDLIEVKKKEKASIDINVQFIEMEENIRERDGFIKYWLSRGIGVKIRKKLSWAGLVESRTVSGTGAKRHICRWIPYSMAIIDTGKVSTCPVDQNARFEAGNLNELSIKEVWNGKLKELRDMHKKGEWDKLPYPCDQCEDWKVSDKDEVLWPAGKNVIEAIKRKIRKIVPAKIRS